jgi:N-methylhydantoinase A
MGYVVGVDVGGTFTDLVCLDEHGNSVVVKVPSTPADPSQGVMDGLAEVARAVGKDLQGFLKATDRITHGTTVSTNTILTWSGARVGLLTTKGFRDILGIRFGIREHPYDLTIPQPEPLVPRYLRVPIEERVRWDGQVVKPLNEQEVLGACRFFREQGVEAVAVCFLWSFKNPDNERRAVEICRKELPDVYVCGSYEISPEVREYWRMSTTVINAYVGPKLSKYIRHLRDSLREWGFSGELLITQSNAGVISPEVAMEQAVRTVLSGPSTAPAAAAYTGKALGLRNVITVDMGGTSFDVCLIKDGAPTMTMQSAVGGVYHLKLPMVDVRTIGAGGGSIGWVDALGVLHMGPKSAGADPGPACYGKGGTEPTCTDADLVLGYLNPDNFLGGRIRLRPELAQRAIEEKIAKPLGLSVIDAALAMRKVIDANMADAMSVVSVEKGEDPRGYTLVVGGGAGPVHAADLAKRLGIRSMLVPLTSSVFCALGAVIADVRHDFVRSITTRTSTVDLRLINDTFAAMKEAGDTYLGREGIDPSARYYRRFLEMRYKGQYHELEVPVPDGDIDAHKLEEVVESFHRLHETYYSYRDVTDTEIINARLSAYGKVYTPPMQPTPFVSRDASAHVKGRREVYFEEDGTMVSTPIYDGDSMEVGNLVRGPAIIELSTTTVVLPPGATLEVTPYDSFLIELQ